MAMAPLASSCQPSASCSSRQAAAAAAGPSPSSSYRPIAARKPWMGAAAVPRHLGCGAATQRAGRGGSRVRAVYTDDAPGPSSPSSSTASSPTPSQQQQGTFEFACPICHTSRLLVTKGGGSSNSTPLRCARCARTFDSSAEYVDLTVSSGAAPRVYRQRLASGTELFRSPLVSFAYERGWRQGFASAGFPGADAEFDMAMEYLAPAYGAPLVDMSCGSGLFSRRFVASGRFSSVVAADYSESMLRQAGAYLREARPPVPPEAYCLLRADVTRMPFATGSVAGLHAGAAIHCWPDPLAALAEISRVLRPGGVFVGSTFMNTLAPLGALLGDEFVRPLGSILPEPRGGAMMKTWEEEELRELGAAVGLSGFRRRRDNRFILFAMEKPAMASEGQ